MSRETCPTCGRTHGTSDRSGGHCSACHLSFRSQSAFDKHRTGPYDGQRRCLTPDEMEGKGWSLDDKGDWRMKAPTSTWWAAS